MTAQFNLRCSATGGLVSLSGQTKSVSSTPALSVHESLACFFVSYCQRLLSVCGACKTGKLEALFTVRTRGGDPTQTPKAKAGSKLAAGKARGTLSQKFYSPIRLYYQSTHGKCVTDSPRSIRTGKDVRPSASDSVLTLDSDGEEICGEDSDDEVFRRIMAGVGGLRLD